jgi:hypothetical protein
MIAAETGARRQKKSSVCEPDHASGEASSIAARTYEGLEKPSISEMGIVALVTYGGNFPRIYASASTSRAECAICDEQHARRLGLAADGL